MPLSRRRSARPSSLLVLVLGLALPGGAGAGPLVSATLQLRLGDLPPLTFVATGASGSSTGNLYATVDAGSAFAGTLTTSVPTTAAPPITGIFFTVASNDQAVFSGATPGSVGGSALFRGGAFVEGFGGLILLGVPLQIGIPSVVFKSASGVNITTTAGPWTVGATTVALTGTATAMATGSNGLTAGGAGTLVLVSPIRVQTNIAGTLAAFGVLTLNYVPEPGTAWLLGLGAAVLGVAGRRKL